MRTKPTVDNRVGKVPKKPYRENSRRLGGARAGIDLTKTLSLAAALEDEEVLRKTKTC
jgi:hypothetical protein